MEKRREFIINILYITAIIFLIYAAIKYALPLLFPFVLALVIAAALQKPIVYLSKKTRLTEKAAAIILCVFIILLLAAVLFFIGNAVIENVEGFVSSVSGVLKNLPRLFENLKASIINISNGFPESLKAKIEGYLNNVNITEILSSLNISSPLSGVFGAAMKIPGIIVSTGIFIISTVFISMDYRKIVNFIFARLSQKHQNTVMDVKQVFFSTVLKLIKSYLIIMLITFSEISVSFLLMKLLGIYDSDYIILISLLITVVDILPIFGTGTVLIPWSLYEFITGNVKMGIFLLISYLVISTVRSIIEPKIVGNQANLSPVVTLLAMYLGLKLFGIIGLFILPVCVMIVKLLSDAGKIRLWKKS